MHVYIHVTIVIFKFCLVTGILFIKVSIIINNVILFSSQLRVFNNRNYIMEEAITGDYALIKGWRADSHGNMVFRMASRNFNVPMAKAAKITIAEVHVHVHLYI